MFGGSLHLIANFDKVNPEGSLSGSLDDLRRLDDQLGLFTFSRSTTNCEKGFRTQSRIISF